MKKKKKLFSRYSFLVLVMLIVFSGILVRLIYMQIVNTDNYKQQSNTDATKDISEPAPRGNITDKNGVILATDKQSYVLTFTETSDSKNKLFDTMEEVFSTLDSRKEAQQDNFELKINPFRFDFNTNDPTVEQAREVSFKRDRGLDEAIILKKYGPNKKWDDLSIEQQNEVKKELLAITPEETFNLLWKQYTDTYLSKTNKDITASEKQKISSLTLEQQRRFMIVLDALKMQSFSGYKPITIASDITRDTAFIFEQKLNELPGIDVTIQPVRTYPYKDLASNVIGYISRINSDNQEKYEEQGYDVNTDMVGVGGIEGAYEDRLKGTKGEDIVEVDKSGRSTSELAKMDPYPGQNIQLTIDKNVQEAAEKALDNVMQQLQNDPNRQDVYTKNATRGAAVAIDVNTGAVIALASRPGFDPNNFVTGLTPDQQKQYFNPDLEQFGNNFVNGMGLAGKNPGMTQQQIVDMLFPKDTSIPGNTTVRKDEYDLLPKPLFDYATSSLIPPGSSFKPTTAIAGLQTGVITPGFTVDDRGFFDDGHNFKTTFPSDGANGTVNLAKALAKSSNPYFMTVGQRLRDAFGDDILAQFAWKLGLGVKPNSGATPSTGIEIPESFGQVYNSWSNKNLYAQTYLAKVMDTLKSGQGTMGNSFPPIDLYYNNNDTDDLRSLKKQIKDDIQDSIKTGNRNKATYVDLITKLVNMDDTYKGKKFTKNDIGSIADQIGYVAVDDAYSQLIVGANMYNAAIGQGMNLFTPLQLADYIATLVNGGNRYKIHLVDKITDADGTVVQQTKPEVLNTTGFNQSNVNAIKEGMKDVTGEGGTAAGAFTNFPIQTGGKTGSATYRKDQDRYGRTSYGFFVGFAPYDHPQIAVCVVVFDGGYGAYVAPVARDIYEAYFKDELKKQGYVPQDSFMQDMYK